MIYFIKAISRKPTSIQFSQTIFFIWFNIVYVTLICNTFGTLPNNRYRFAVDAFYVIIFGLILTSGFEKMSQTKYKNSQSE